MADRAPVRIAVEPSTNQFFVDAVIAGGGVVEPLDATSEALVWGRPHDYAGLAAAIAASPGLRWVQLPSAGVDDYHSAGVLTPAIRWTSAKGSYAVPVAEHALALTLGLLRRLHERARATSWGAQAGTSLHGLRVLVLGAGGIAEEFARLTAPFGVELVVCRRSSGSAGFGDRTVDFAKFGQESASADVILLAAPLTDETAGIVTAAVLEGMKSTAILVNVARGGLVDSDGLVAALAAGSIEGAGIDVTDPEPLPDGHPLWTEPRALVTPHSADTWEMIQPLLAERITENVSRYASGEQLVGVVDPATGY